MRNKLISSLAGVAIAALIGTSALAAAPKKKIIPPPPPPPPAPVYSWTGWYVGGNVGYGWGNANTDLTGNGNFTSFASCIGAGCLPGQFLQVPNSFAFAASNTAHPNGVIGGGQIGYNYQFSPNAVLGFEADIQGSGERASGQFADPFVLSFCETATASGVCTSSFPINGAASTSYQAKIDWFGTVRARLVWPVNDQLLIYGTSGLAYGEVAVSGNANISATLSAASGFPPPYPSRPLPQRWALPRPTSGAAVWKDGFRIGSRRTGLGNWNISIWI
jgi:outer membrane immunogenic protein